MLANIVNIRHKLFAVKRQTRGRERDLQVLQLSSLKFPIPEYNIKLEVTIARVLPHSQGIKGSMCMQFAE